MKQSSKKYWKFKSFNKSGTVYSPMLESGDGTKRLLVDVRVRWSFQKKRYVKEVAVSQGATLIKTYTIKNNTRIAALYDNNGSFYKDLSFVVGSKWYSVFKMTI